MKNKTLVSICALFLMLFALSNKSFAHCEIPCGIYGDSMRIDMIEEHIRTIEKSMDQIIVLSEEDDEDYNQIVRWVVNKEEHAKKIQDIVSQYFLHQRIKPVDPGQGEMYEKYIKRLSLLHELMIYAMNAKQTTDMQFIEKMRNTLREFEDSYFHTHEH